jgi:hypothetical protein
VRGPNPTLQTFATVSTPLEPALVAACGRCERGLKNGAVEQSVTEFIAALAALRAHASRAAWRRTVGVVRAQPVHAMLLEDPYIAAAFANSRTGAGAGAATLDFVHRYREAPSSTSASGRRLFRISTDLPVACAVRARTRFIADAISARAAARTGATIVAVGCGYMREMEWLDPWTDATAQVVGIDPDDDAVAHVKRSYGGVVTARRITVKHMLSRLDAVPRADMIYASELVDRLDDRAAATLIRRLRARLATGGVLTIATLTPQNDEMAFMEATMNWWIAGRDQHALGRLAGSQGIDARTCGLMGGRVACLRIQG